MDTKTVFYIGKKKIKRDSVAGTGHVWIGYGSSNEVEASAAQQLFLHHDIWVDEVIFKGIAEEGLGDRVNQGISLSDERIDELSELLRLSGDCIDAVQEQAGPMHAALLAINELGDKALDPRLVVHVAVLRAGVMAIRAVLNPAEEKPGIPAPSLNDATGPTANAGLSGDKLVAAVVDIIINLPADGYNNNGTPSIEAVRTQAKAQIGDVEINTSVVREAYGIVKAGEPDTTSEQSGAE